MSVRVPAILYALHVSVDGIDKPDHQTCTYGPPDSQDLTLAGPLRREIHFLPWSPRHCWDLPARLLLRSFPLLLIVTQLLTFQTYQLNQNLANQNILSPQDTLHVVEMTLIHTVNFCDINFLTCRKRICVL